jgi:hypothetical protein
MLMWLDDSAFANMGAGRRGFLNGGSVEQVRSILATLMDVLKTPSGEVQRAVSDCLSPLMPAVSGDRAYVESLVKLLLQRLTKGSSYGDRRVFWQKPPRVFF